MLEQSLPLKTMLETINYDVVDARKKKDLLKDTCFYIGKIMSECNPMNLQFSPTNFYISSSDSIILPESFITEFDLVPSIVYITAIYYCLRMRNSYSTKEKPNTFTKVESVLSMENDYDQNYHALRRLVIGTSLSFISSKILSTFYISEKLSKEEIRRIEKDTIIKSYLKQVLDKYYQFHKEA